MKSFVIYIGYHVVFWCTVWCDTVCNFSLYKYLCAIFGYDMISDRAHFLGTVKSKFFRTLIIIYIVLKCLWYVEKIKNDEKPYKLV